MNIHQMQLNYDPAADRLLWQLRTFGGEMFAIWLTRRMLRQLWPPLQGAVTQSGLARLLPNATPTPEARQMLNQAVRDRPLPTADFSKPFESQPVAQPLGAQPLLPSGIQLTAGLPGGGIILELREAAGRQLKLQLSDDLATALTRLVQQALGDADWGIAVPPAAAAEVTRPAVLN